MTQEFDLKEVFAKEELQKEMGGIKKELYELRVELKAEISNVRLEVVKEINRASAVVVITVVTAVLKHFGLA